MDGHMSCYGWAWVVADGYRLGMGTSSKENVGLWCEVALIQGAAGHAPDSCTGRHKDE